MGLTALEWILLPKEQQEIRGHELSHEECRKLRMEYSEIHFTEEEKGNMTDEEKYRFTHPPKLTEEQKLKSMKSSYGVLKGWGLLPKELSFEQWKENGCQLNYHRE